MGMTENSTRAIILGLVWICTAQTVFAGDGQGEAAAQHAVMAGTPQGEADNPVSDVQLIASAELAAPTAVARHATIVAPSLVGMRILRQGTNGFTCMPSNPNVPGPNQMCWDKAAQGWIDAIADHRDPPAGKVGFMYMLAGGTDLSNTDPFARKPSADHCIRTGPHIMIVGADPTFYDAYPRDADPDTTQPYVMWAGTPYQHLMVPVK
jgi:hypothetical protein